LVIVGSGYTGLRIYQQAIETGWHVFATSRQPQIHLPTIPTEHRIRFDLTQPETWVNIPDPAHLLWCFPAVPLNLVRKFLSARTKQPIRLLVTGSTSAYTPDEHPITENTPLKTHVPRVQTEEYLRSTYGAVIVRFAGLYGPGRHVLDWIRKSKIQNTPRWVNLLHVEDAAAICLHALEQASDGTTYLASDGHPRTWSDICSVASSKWRIAIPPLTQTQHAGKHVSIYKLRTELKYTLRFPDLYQALEQIETMQNMRREK
jgi:nucleoside-diphosphate-sugar epimerase